MNQTGVASTGSRRHARRNRSFTRRIVLRARPLGGGGAGGSGRGWNDKDRKSTQVANFVQRQPVSVGQRARHVAGNSCQRPQRWAPALSRGGAYVGPAGEGSGAIARRRVRGAGGGRRAGPSHARDAARTRPVAGAFLRPLAFWRAMPWRHGNRRLPILAARPEFSLCEVTVWRVPTSGAGAQVEPRLPAGGTALRRVARAVDRARHGWQSGAFKSRSGLGSWSASASGRSEQHPVSSWLRGSSRISLLGAGPDDAAAQRGLAQYGHPLPSRASAGARFAGTCYRGSFSAIPADTRATWNRYVYPLRTPASDFRCACAGSEVGRGKAPTRTNWPRSGISGAPRDASTPWPRCSPSTARLPARAAAERQSSAGGAAIGALPPAPAATCRSRSPPWFGSVDPDRSAGATPLPRGTRTGDRHRRQCRSGANRHAATR